MGKLNLFLAAAMVASSPATASLAAASGTALGVTQDAKSQTKSEIKVLDVGSDVNIGDKVITDAKGLVEIRFSDETRLVVGPNSALVMEDYLLRNNGSAGKFAVDALSGTFRFITGGAEKDKYQIKTPTGTIGVRGTRYDFSVSKTQTHILVYEGKVIFCNLAGKCETLDGSCQVGQYDKTEAEVLGKGTELTPEERKSLRKMFPYSENQNPLLSPFKIADARACLNQTFDAGDPGFIDIVSPTSDHTALPERPFNPCEEDPESCY